MQQSHTQRQPTQLPPAEVTARIFQFRCRKAQTKQNALSTSLVIVTSLDFKVGTESIVFASDLLRHMMFGDLMLQILETQFNLAQWFEAGKRLGISRIAKINFRYLGNSCGCGVAGADQAALVRVHFSLDQFQQCGLSDPIPPYQPDVVEGSAGS